MPLRRKLLFAMMIPAILLITVGAIGIYSLRHLEQAAGRILADNYRSIQETRRMEEALRAFLSIDTEARRLSTHRSPNQIIQQFETALDRCEANITESGETAVLQSIRIALGRVAANSDGSRQSCHRDPAPTVLPRSRISTATSRSWSS